MSSSTSSSTSSLSSKDETKRKASFERRQLTLMKKAQELSTLCGIQVSVICYGPDGELQTWPRDLSKVRDMADKYKKLTQSQKRKKSLNLSEFQEKRKSEQDETKKGFDLDTHKLDGRSTEELSELRDFLDLKLKTLQERLRFLDTQKQRIEEPSKSEHCQSSNVSRNQEIHQPAIISDFADTALPLVPVDQQVTESVDLHGNPLFSAFMLDENYASFNNVGGYGSVPLCYSNDTSDLGQASIPSMSFQNLLAYGRNGDCSYNSDFPSMDITGQISSCGNMNMNMEDYSNFLVPQAYGNNGFQDVSGLNSLMMNKNNNNSIGVQSPFPQIQIPSPLQQFGPLSAWNPTPSA